MRSALSRCGVLFLFFSLTVSGPVVCGQFDDPDVIDVQPGEPLDLDSAYAGDTVSVAIDTLEEYGEFYDERLPHLNRFTALEYSIDLSGSNSRMYRSLNDAIRHIPSFYSLETGPFGQEYGVSFLGLPPYLCARHPDPAGSYETYRFPPAGLLDLRLFSLEQGDELLVRLDGPISPVAEVRLCSTPHDEPDALTEVSVFKGGYSYANTDVRFSRLASRKLGWGFNVGIEKSAGDAMSSAKERENYGLNLRYRVTPKWQLSSRIRILTTGDSVAQYGRWSKIADTRDGFLRVIELEALSADSNSAFRRGFMSYQTFEEKIRGRYLHLAQKHGSIRCGIDIAKDLPGASLYLLPRLVFNRVEFTPGYDYYTRINIDGGVNLLPEHRITYLLTGRYLYDWGGVSRFGYGARASFRATDDLSTIASADLFHVPPSDMARFLRPQGFDVDRDGVQEYNHGGNRALEPARLSSLSGSVGFTRPKCGLAVTAKAGRVDDMVIWQRYEGTLGGLYQAETCDANLLASMVSADVSPIENFRVVSGYTYARLVRRGGGDDVSLMPRHNAYAGLSWKQHVGSLKLDVFPNVEAEYHSTNYRNYFSGVDLDGYLVVHGRLCVKIKSFTFYYSMENLFGSSHRTVDGFPSYRRVWWGFRWIFLN